MKGNKEVIALLNEVLTAELTGINQYFLHAKLCQNWGYKRLAKRNRDESIDEMKHADELIERILYLDGVPNLQRLFKVNVGESVPEQLKLDLELEKEAIARLNKGIELTRNVGDNGTRELLAKLLVSEEEHADWLETQLRLVAELGAPQYLTQQMHD